MLEAMRATALKPALDELLARQDVAARRASDPVGYVHRFARADDQEVVGLLASSLAFGQVVTVRASIEKVLDVLGPSPARAVDAADEVELAEALRGFRHRVYRGEHVARMLARAGALRLRDGSLGRAFERLYARHGGLRPALTELAEELRGPDAPRGLGHLLASPEKGSACKRLLLYLRWMARPSDGVDLGLWNIPPSALVVPLDTHVHRIARNLGLTARNDASWRTAEEVTAALRRLDPDDPVKYDFALCHHGVSRECPSRRVDAKCGACVLRGVCVAYAGGRRATPSRTRRAEPRRP
jgi:uncharacterized protein (TIGR02757 family)